MLWFENYDLVNIQTPVDADKFDQLLKEANFDKNKREFIVNGFSNGFSLEIEDDPNDVTREAHNLPLTIGTKTELWNKLMKEVELKRVAGPFKEPPPFKNFIQSPIGLVPKDGGKKKLGLYSICHILGMGSTNQ